MWVIRGAMCSRRWTKAMEQWRAFHSDMQELSAWLDEAETKLAAAKGGKDVTTAESTYMVRRHAVVVCCWLVA